MIDGCIYIYICMYPKKIIFFNMFLFCSASKLVGEGGKVIGVDMTGSQLSVAIKHIDWHMKKYGYKKPNVQFLEGYIEDLSTAGIQVGW